MDNAKDRTPKPKKRVFLVISDIHYDEENFISAIKKHPEADTVLFLGDGYRIFDAVSFRYPRTGFIGVRGNCDYDAQDAALSNVLDVNGLKIFLCHGHTLGVKSGLGALAVTAKSNGCSVALFGHTHLPVITEKETSGGKITLFNPGSIGSPSMGKHPSYGILTVFPDGNFTVSAETL